MTFPELEDEVQLHNKFLTSHLTNLGKKGFYKHQFISQSEAETKQTHGSTESHCQHNTNYIPETKRNFCENS